MGQLDLGQDKFPRGRDFVLFIFARYHDRHGFGKGRLNVHDHEQASWFLDAEPDKGPRVAMVCPSSQLCWFLGIMDGSRAPREMDGMNRSERGGPGGVECNGPGPRQLVSEIIVGREAVMVLFVCAVLGTTRDYYAMAHGPWRPMAHLAG